MEPATFGRYLLMEELARGGMAVVYRAVLRDRSGFEKQVALKRMLRDLGQDPEFVARFVDEARIVSTLTHANVAQIFDFGQVEGEYFLAMELVDGPDLGTLLQACRSQGQPVPIPTGVYIVAEMTRGLGVAHGRTTAGRPAPVVHRDVSPQNVLLSRAGEIKVVDFGIAKAAEKMMRTRTGMIMGKCRYMAPEQATGAVVDARADVFASGAVLFEVLTGRMLFDGETANQVLRQVAMGRIPAASEINPEVPPELDEILARALARSPDERYADCSAMARDLEALLHRMVPDFTGDDVARFIQAMVPPGTTGWDAAATREQDGDADRRSIAYSATLAGNALAVEPIRPEPGPTAPGVTLPPVDLDRPTAGFPRRRVALGLGCGIVALLVGLGTRLLIVADAGPRRTARLATGKRLRHHGWSVGLERIQRGRTRLLITLSVTGPRAASVEAASFALLQAGTIQRPLVASRAPGSPGQLTLVFPASTGDLLLRFAPTDAPPLLVRIAAP